MGLRHEPGCDRRHTARQRCNRKALAAAAVRDAAGDEHEEPAPVLVAHPEPADPAARDAGAVDVVAAAPPKDRQRRQLRPASLEPPRGAEPEPVTAPAPIPPSSAATGHPEPVPFKQPALGKVALVVGAAAVMAIVIARARQRRDT